MIRVYAKEFVAVCKYMERSQCKKTKKYLYVKRDELIPLLEKNNYDSSNAKIKLWKKLGWIDSDGNHLTKRVFDKETNKYLRLFALRRDVYATLKPLV